MDDKEIKFEIKEAIGDLGETGKGWRMEANLVSWNDRAPKIDIRPWDGKHERMGKGITLTLDEAELLWKALGPYLEKARSAGK